MLRILHDTHIDFIKRWRLVTVLIVAFLVPALVWIAVDGVRGGSKAMFNRGVEFTSGTAVQVKFAQPPDLADLRTAMNTAVKDVEVQTFGSPSDVILRAAERADADTGSAETVADGI